MQVTNTFSKGMNSDTDKSLISKDQYLYSENFRLYTETGNTAGALENIAGNTLLTDSLGLSSSYKVCGYCYIRDELYVFRTTNTSTTPSGGTSIITKHVFNTAGTDISSSSIIYSDSIYTNKLNFSSANKIKAVGRYESDTVKKLYWVDGYNVVRFANVGDTISTLDPNKFDIVNNFLLSTPTFIEFGTGSLTAGKVQYAYQMYDKYGSETLFSPATNLISVSASSGMTGSNKTFKGSDKGTNTGKGIKLSITPPIGFDLIRVVSIMYTALNATPTITIIAEQEISDSSTSSTIYFYDAGTSALGTYTLEEFSIVGVNIFIANEIEVKDNYLFVGNISQTDWDFDYDARAYRFLSASHSVSQYRRTAVLKNIPDSSTTGDIWINGAYPSGGSGYTAWNAVPTNHNCGNLFNNTSMPQTEYVLSKYKADGTTVGGEGLNVSYVFEQGSIIISSTGTTYTEDYSLNTDYSSATVELSSMGYQRGEIYRFGVIFFNNKGQSSTVKWIGDIRMPNVYDGYNIVSHDGSNINAYTLSIQFVLNTSVPYANGAKYFRIVRCERTTDNRSILAQGMVGALTLYTKGPNYYGNPHRPTYKLGSIVDGTNVTVLYRKYVEFLSPEINFNKNLSYKSGDSLELLGYYYDSGSTAVGGSITHATVTKYHSISPISPLTYYEMTATNKSVIADYVVTAINSRKASDLLADFAVDIGADYNYVNWNQWDVTRSPDDASGTVSSGATKLIINLQTIVPNSPTTDHSLLCNYRRHIINSQYGGFTYQARQNNTYIACGDLQQCTGGSSDTTHVYGGDTYISMYDYLRNIVLQDQTTKTALDQLVLYFPVETSINLRYRQDDCYSKTTDPGNNGKLLLNEKAGTYQFSGDVTVSLTQLTDLYVYNTVYSQQNTTVSYIPKSDLIDSDTNNYDCRIWSSNVKINGETPDNWTKFQSDNYIDVDSTYGKLTNLKTYRNLLYFFQPKGFGVASVNARSLLQDGTSGGLVLGTGGVLDRIDYISNVSGCSDRFSVVAGLNGLYWYDRYNKSINKFGNQEEGLSKLRGVNSLLTDTTSSTLSESISVYDKKNNEVLFKIYRSDLATNCMLSYSEMFDSFNGIYTYNTNWLLQSPNTNYISIYDTSQKLYMHNIGSKGSFYGTVSDSKLKTIINDNYPYTKVFDMLEYHSTAKNTTTNILANTFSSIRAYNDYQNSDFTTLTINSNLTRKERGFTVAIPRNSVNSSNNVDIFNSSNLDATRTFRERMKDKYLILDLTYSNANAYNFSIPYIITNYRISKR